MQKLKITNPDGNIHYVPATNNNIRNHTKRNDLAPENKKDRLEIVDDVKREGDNTVHGEVIKVIREGSQNPHEAKATIAKASAALAEKDAALVAANTELEELKAKLAAATAKEAAKTATTASTNNPAKK